MFFKNQIDIEGRLCQTPELKKSANGTSYCRFSICYNQNKKDKATGNYTNIPHFFNCVTFKSLAETVADFKKGDPVTIGGTLNYNSYEKDGKKNTNVSIIVNSIKLLYIPKKAKKVMENTPTEEPINDERMAQFNSNFSDTTYDPDSDIPFQEIKKR